MTFIDEVLTRVGLKYEDLNYLEKETLFGWLNVLSKRKITIESVKAYIASMRNAVEEELTKTDHNSKQDLLLKARLRNYMLLEAFLSTPEKAKEAIDRALAGMVKSKK